MSFAVIKTGGKQYVVQDGTTIEIEKIDGVSVGDTVTFDHVLLTDSGSATEVGMPTVAGAKVEAKVLEAGKGDKKVVIKYKQKSRYFKKRGHRQPYLKVKIGKV